MKNTAFLSPSTISGIGAIFEITRENKIIFHSSIPGAYIYVLAVTDFYLTLDLQARLVKMQ